MSQQTTFLSLRCLTQRTLAARFLDEMNQMVPWTALAEIVAPHCPVGWRRPTVD